MKLFKVFLKKKKKIGDTDRGRKLHTAWARRQQIPARNLYFM